MSSYQSLADLVRFRPLTRHLAEPTYDGYRPSPFTDVQAARGAS